MSASLWTAFILVSFRAPAAMQSLASAQHGYGSPSAALLDNRVNDAVLAARIHQAAHFSPCETAAFWVEESFCWRDACGHREEPQQAYLCDPVRHCVRLSCCVSCFSADAPDSFAGRASAQQRRYFLTSV
eukprot:TRINITY_DN32772_c0_g2_i4.p1 TRINITY_DN32772_c0_g2~~TRINITY_DN32772_c0_g2_i4.p1  ORF type:complete len:130 (-),score=5.83 TRINITY_DN32772_c0_g2_i4:21-410(-)